MLWSAVLSLFQCLWSLHWARIHLRVRAGRTYAHGRTCTHKDTLYRALSPLLFASQLGLSLACLWTNAPWLLQFHDELWLRGIGAGMLACGTWCYRCSLENLGQNYSPCYDSHLPRELVTSGPFRRIRHPMFLAKLIVGLGTLLFSGTFWFVPGTLYLFFATLRALHREERLLMRELPGYRAYAARTHRLIPYLY